MNTLVLLMILLPGVGAVLAGLTKKKLSDVSAFLSVTAMLVIALVVVLNVYPGSLRNLPISLPWLQEVGVEDLFGYQIDPLGMIMLLVVVVLGFLVVTYSLAYLGVGNKEHPSREGKERHHFWMLLFICSMVGVATSPNLLQMYIFWEMTTLTSYALISHYRNQESLRAGFKALLMTVSGGLFFALAIIIIYVQTGSFDYSALNQLTPQLRAWMFIFFMIAALAKSAQIPFYTWLPDAMAAPTTVSMYLHAAAMVKAGVFLMARIGTASFALSYGSGLVLGIVAVVTMLVALFLFFYQDDLKRLLAYSTIAHLSYVLLGVSFGIMGSKTGMFGGIMHIMNHGVGKGLLFLCVGAIAYTTGTRSISKISGLVKTAPLTSIAFLVGMFAILGVPPFSGFWSKFYLLIGAIDLGGTAGIILLIPFLLEIIIAFGWFLNVGHRVFFGEVSEAAAGATNPPFAMSFALVVLMILTIVAPFIALNLANFIGL
jgi:hydrogenase-4 component D